MLFRIDPRSAEPIFEQILFLVKGGVARGELSDGDRLPSVRELARTLSVNPNTVVRAYQALEREGVILRRQGAGCFITEKGEALNARERRKRLGVLMKRTVTEAHHLGSGPDEIREALDTALENVRFPGRPGERKKK